MTEAEIQAALGKRLLTMSDCPPVLWPNTSITITTPYLVVEFLPGEKTDNTLAGGGIQSEGQMMVTVVTSLDVNNAASLLLAENIVNHFPRVARLVEGSTTVVIYTPSRALQGYRSGPNWRTPVRVNYKAS